MSEHGPGSGQGRWAYHPPPWKRRLGVVALVAGMAGMTLGAKGWAQMASAPFVFEGEVLRIETPGWESNGDYLVDASAYIDVQEGVNAHISGNIGAAFGSRNGLYKLGGGTLRLSGETSYMGSTRLLQGGLHVDGPGVFGLWGGIEALRGTVLEYGSDIDVGRPLALRSNEISDYLAPSYYTPVVPPTGLEHAVGWKVAAGRAVHSGLLQGDVPFVKLGSGVLDITGDAMAYTGAARVAEGTLAVNEIFSGSVNVGAGARLRGTGSVGAVHVEAGGVLAPGNAPGNAPGLAAAGSEPNARFISSVNANHTHVVSGPGPMPGTGTLWVAGDLRFDSGSRFEVRALPRGESDSVWVGGKALLDGEVTVLAHNGVWQASTSYQILSAQGGLQDSEFASVKSDLAFLTPSLSYDEHAVTLSLMRNDLPIEDVGETPDEEEVGKAIDEEVPGGETPGVVPETPRPPTDVADGGDPAPEEEAGKEPPKANPDLNDAIVGQDKESARQALRQLAGSWNASVLSSVWDDSRFMREAVLRRSMARVGASAMHRPVTATSVSGAGPALQPWFEAFSSDQVRDGRQGISGDQRRLQGFMLGVSAAVSTAWHAGVFLGAQHSQLEREQGLAHADVETTHFGVHVAGVVAGVRLALGSARSLHRLNSHRLIIAGTLRDALRARYRGDTTQVFGEAEWPVVERAWPSGQADAGGAPQGIDGGDASGVTEGFEGQPVRKGMLAQGMHRLRLAPFARLAWVRTGLDGFVESGGPAALKAQPTKMSAWLTTLGLRAEASNLPAKIYMELAWHHAGSNRAESTQTFRDSATQTLFRSQGLTAGRQSWSLQLGLDAGVGKASTVGFAYLGRYGSGLRDQGIGGWARIAF